MQFRFLLVFRYKLRSPDSWQVIDRVNGKISRGLKRRITIGNK